MIVTFVVLRTTHVFATFVSKDFTTGYAIDRLWGSITLFCVQELRG
jgi:hypothetical protein